MNLYSTCQKHHSEIHQNDGGTNISASIQPHENSARLVNLRKKDEKRLSETEDPDFDVISDENNDDENKPLRKESDTKRV